MQNEEATDKRLQELENRVLKLEQSEQLRAEAGLELIRKMAVAAPDAALPETQPIAAAVAKTRRHLAKLERKAKCRKPRQTP